MPRTRGLAALMASSLVAASGAARSQLATIAATLHAPLAASASTYAASPAPSSAKASTCTVLVMGSEPQSSLSEWQAGGRGRAGSFQRCMEGLVRCEKVVMTVDDGLWQRAHGDDAVPGQGRCPKSSDEGPKSVCGTAA
eukprot:4532700-Prymnesium_polylepis.1